MIQHQRCVLAAPPCILCRRASLQVLMLTTLSRSIPITLPCPVLATRAGYGSNLISTFAGSAQFSQVNRRSPHLPCSEGVHDDNKLNGL